VPSSSSELAVRYSVLKSEHLAKNESGEAYILGAKQSIQLFAYPMVMVTMFVLQSSFFMHYTLHSNFQVKRIISGVGKESSFESIFL
jgi:hypothetical protein